ncbi:uncharacterized protein GGS22DRAFT_199093 [Annulohypoxylon maeteangense]|uniref:uncharacterized protein n=1 Tax=Annulohypoxylon maeteangense TaxID=1927788 RepID=UPI0020082D33|nr:uncharacterized protein GGS22DRAFT_199093 [Annulohypoxylon maeteangense]KAI0886730.1 hypothetical protein GGS22DRAFT_199093 [Annulohypoxylon maeteangense]
MANLLSLFSKKATSYQPVVKEETQYCDTDSINSSTEGFVSHEQNSFHEDSRSRRYIWLFFHFFVFTSYTIVYVMLIKHGIITAKSSCKHTIYSPAYEAVVKEPMEFQGQLRIISPYQGPPSPEVDMAWKELLQYSNIRVSGEDLRKVNKTSIPMPGENDSYWVELSVVHELHCIKRLRQYWFNDYYFPNITEEEHRLNWLHNDHCLEILRQSVMCHADVSMITMAWTSTSVFPAADFQNVHECTNWDILYEWQKERSVDLMQPGLLVHPELGVPFPEGHYDGVGAADPDHAIGTDGEVPEELIAMGIREGHKHMLRTRGNDD